MRQTSVATLKARLSEYLQAVKAGEEIIVTDRGKPVARLVPVRGAERLSAHMISLIRAGHVRPAAGRLPKDFWSMRRPKDPEARVLAALLEERAESR
jgi:prevent-host-death family protein